MVSKNNRGDGPVTLTRQEKVVLMFLMRTYWDSKRIAKQMCCSKSTVDWHASNLYDKFGVSGRLQLLHYLFKVEPRPEASDLLDH